LLIKIDMTSTKYLGRLIWITTQGKVFRSSKRFDTYEKWVQHDSNSVGTLKSVFPSIYLREDILNIIKKERIYGVYLENETIFFKTWQELSEYSQIYFNDYDARKERERRAERLEIEQIQRRIQEEREREAWKTRQKAIEKHKKKTGLFSIFSPPFREACCYQCQNSLFSSKHDTCKECKWMICTCGACGCLYNSK
jgi:hypothetical protein